MKVAAGRATETLTAMSHPYPPQQLDSSSYGFHSLDRRSIALLDGTVRTYFALPPDYAASPGSFPTRSYPAFGYEPPHFPAGSNPDSWHSLLPELLESAPPSLKRMLGLDDGLSLHRQLVLHYGNPYGGSSGTPPPPSNFSNELLPAAGGINNDIASLEDILIEILSWLPAASLSRFRFVSNHWCSLITNDPTLAQLQLQRGYKSSSPSVLICTGRRRLTLIDHEGGHKHLVYSTEEPLKGISPSCKGLICIYGEKNDAALFNPTTQEELVLPNPTKIKTSSKFFIGYVPTTKEYKIIRFFDMPTRCEVLTIGTSSWRHITINSGFGCGTRIASSIEGGVSTNGIMYWIIGSWGGGPEEILSFDLNKERFNIVQFPGFLDGDDFLSEVEGKVFVAQVRVEMVEIWILEDLTSQTWVKRYTPWFPERSGPPILIHQGKLLVKSNEGLQYRDLKTGLINFGSIYNDELKHYYCAQSHVESLVSIKALC